MEGVQILEINCLNWKLKKYQLPQEQYTVFIMGNSYAYHSTQPLVLDELSENKSFQNLTTPGT